MSLTLSKAEIKRLAEEREKLEAIKKQIQIEILRPGDASNFPKKGIDYIWLLSYDNYHHWYYNNHNFEGDSISIHYKCFLPDGTMIDNRYFYNYLICHIFLLL